MKVRVHWLAFIVAVLALSTWAQTPAINGTWSGDWTPNGGVLDAVTIELKLDDSGGLMGKFLNPIQKEFSKATFNRKTRTIEAETTDQKSGKVYKLEGKIAGTELKGTLSSGNVSGELRLIKWTFFGR
jgi:hypothetical protein